MPRRISQLYGLIFVALLATLYAPAFGRGFVSEDFLILRRFFEARGSGDFLAMAWTHLTGPWLDITLVSFFRPLSSLFLQIEEALFGTSSEAYFVTHLGIHLLNTWLVLQVTRRFWKLGGGDPENPVPQFAAALFAVYPLHPNTVVFVASFATLFCGTFFFAGLHFYLQGRIVAASTCLVAALGCYEQAAVLPGMFVASDIILRKLGHRPGHRALRTWIPSFAVLGAYLVARRLLLGHSIGGYSSFRDRLVDPEALLASMLGNLGRMIYPDFGPSSTHTVAAVVACLFTLVATFVWLRARPPAPWTHLVLFGACLLVAGQAPFAFVGVVPGNGRYWYLSSCGLAMLLASLLHLSARLAGRRHRSAVFRVGAAAWVLLYGVLLRHYTQLHAEAGRTTESLRVATATYDKSQGPLFVAGAPSFLVEDGVNSAQVFHWGLADALMPPFTADGPDVYPLPPLEDDAFLPLAKAGSILRYEPNDDPKSVVPSPRLRFKAPPLLGSAPDVESQDCKSVHLVLVAQGNATVRPYPSSPLTNDSWILSMQSLYSGSPIFWWVECRGDGKGRGPLIAVSELARLDPPSAQRSKR